MNRNEQEEVGGRAFAAWTSSGCEYELRSAFRREQPIYEPALALRELVEDGAAEQLTESALHPEEWRAAPLLVGARRACGVMVLRNHFTR